MKSATPPADSQDGSTPGILQRAKAGAAEFAASAKAAALLAAKQAERTKINQISLPAAFQSLGKQLHAAGSYREELASYYQSIDDLQAKIQTLNSASSAEAAPQGVAEKAKALGRAAKELAESKALGLRLNQAFADLGKVAFDKHGEQTAAQSAVSPIIESQKRIAVLESEIQQLNAAYAGKRLTPKRMLIAAAVLLVLIGAYAVFHRRSGNAWTEYHEKEIARSKAEFEPVFLRLLAAGDSAWDAGKKADAVQQYAQLLGQFCGYGKGDASYVAELHKPEMTRVAGRTIDFLADSGNEETAKDLIKRADESNLVVVYSSPNANRLVPAARAEAKADLEKWSQFNAEWEAEQNRGNQADSGSGKTKTVTSPNNSTLDDIPSREELIHTVYLVAAGVAFERKLGSGPSPEEFIELTRSAARELRVDKYDHSRFLLTLKPDRDVTSTQNGTQGRVLRYGPETAIFVKNKNTGRFTFLSCSINGEQKMNLRTE